MRSVQTWPRCWQQCFYKRSMAEDLAAQIAVNTANIVFVAASKLEHLYTHYERRCCVLHSRRHFIRCDSSKLSAALQESHSRGGAGAGGILTRQAIEPFLSFCYNHQAAGTPGLYPGKFACQPSRPLSACSAGKMRSGDRRHFAGWSHFRHHLVDCAYRCLQNSGS